MHPLIRNLTRHAQLTEADRRTLLGAIGPARTVRSGADIVLEGTKPRESTVLLDGLAARYKILGEGKRHITALHILGDFVDLHSFGLKRMDHGVMTLSETQIARVPHSAIAEMVSNSPGLRQAFWTSTLVDAAIHRTWLAQTATDAYCRTAHLVCELFTRYQVMDRVKNNSFPFKMTQVDFGDTLGMSSVHMNRTVMQLRKDGLLTWGRGLVTIPDVDRLKAVARFDPTYLDLAEEEPATVG